MLRRASLVVALLASCAPTPPTARIAPPTPPKHTCEIDRPSLRPLIVDWSSDERIALEARVKKGVTVVRYVGCELKVLDRCHAPGKYGWTSVTRKRDRVTFLDSKELAANLPVGAVKLEGKLASKGEVSVAMTSIGRLESDDRIVQPTELSGACEGATHVIHALTVGAYRMTAGAMSTVSASAGALGAAAGGAWSTSQEVLSEDGDEQSCGADTDGAPPQGCGALLRMELLPLGVPEPKDGCPAGMGWDGAQCVRAKLEGYDEKLATVKPKLRQCLTDAVAEAKKSGSKLTRWTVRATVVVDGAGKTMNVGVDTNDGPAGAALCVAGALKDLEYPPPPLSPYRFSVPVVFNSGDS